MLLVGETNGEHFTIQNVCANPLHVHEEIPQGSSIWQEGNSLVMVVIELEVLGEKQIQL